MDTIEVKAGGKAYSIIIENGLFKRIPDIFKRAYEGKKLALISDSTVFPLYGEALVQNLKQRGFDIKTIVFDAGEERKNLDTLSWIYSGLADFSFTRSDIVVALGGGVTGDMAGLAAATFLRGTGFIQIPTTLLAMVDSSIGGKTAVDLPQGKNLIGAFYQPDAVYTDPMLLETLTDRQFSDGMAELLKHGLIRDEELYKGLSASGGSNARHRIENLDELIATSCRIKRDIVEQDEHDNGIRQLLNFGHTLGHALERIQNYSGLSHGEAVSAGMVIMTRLTENMGLTVKGETEKLIKVLSLFNLPTVMPNVDIHELLAAIRLDKKNRSGRITIAYIERIGQGRLLELDQKELEDRIHGYVQNSADAS